VEETYEFNDDSYAALAAAGIAWQDVIYALQRQQAENPQAHWVGAEHRGKGPARELDSRGVAGKRGRRIPGGVGPSPGLR
jgi:hypothetical protein